ncbi:hypothetical protein [Streptomyces pinistramenti]|uniref:hypothetical protein n=1 Tax=Streptomyces pinistramenti TaxID=2884812 RepID=UPI001D07B417|nr:hypothetical protein [Streptomyces pinistramenti]MCB5912231.1 hypothetical protein [Streptomyces pinistramenti]
MHMNSAPHLLNEDREDFARLLDEALRTAAHRSDLATTANERLTTEQLRTLALGATTTIAARAATEYQHYIRLRDRLRDPDAAATADGEDAERPAATDPFATTADGQDATSETTGAGLGAMIAVLAPVLAGIAAVLFLLIGYALRAIGPEQAAARPLIAVGWIFAALTAAGALVAMGGLVITALRNGASPREAIGYGALDGDLDRARDAWHQALLEHGLLPFLHDAVAAGPDPAPYRATARKSRIPSLGYSRPRFSSPDTGSTGARPRYSSPDFTGPDHEGREERSE